VSFVTTFVSDFPILAGVLALVTSLFAGAVELEALKSKGPPALTWLMGAGAIVGAVGSSSYNSILRLLVIVVLLGALAAGIRWILKNA
jgi:hypothetical protein